MESAPPAAGPSRPRRDCTKQTPYFAAPKVMPRPAARKPIPIELVFTANDAVVNKSSMPDAHIGPAMAGWKWLDNFGNGFGTILPPRARNWNLIHNLMIAAVVDGFTPELDTHHARIHAEVHAVGDSQADIFNRYVAACERGDVSFKLEIDNVWTCRDYNPCFGGDSVVLMAAGGHVPIRDLAVSDSVQVPGGTAKVAAVWRAHVGRSIPMSCIDGVLLTPDHPVFVAGIWLTAGEVAAPTEVEVDSVYNFALTAPCSLFVRGSLHAEGHIECCTLGMPVPGFPEPVWGTEKIFDKMRALPDYPNVATYC
ncbi:hypothetical protein T492DRAFT_956142 [Pavlovales sp. CCMP2436]|nr:hypothetical protein T492DRAFT_956142 [Pavlovales sp. CCMP2436]